MLLACVLYPEAQTRYYVWIDSPTRNVPLAELKVSPVEFLAEKDHKKAPDTLPADSFGKKDSFVPDGGATRRDVFDELDSMLDKLPKKKNLSQAGVWVKIAAVAENRGFVLNLRHGEITNAFFDANEYRRIVPSKYWGSTCFERRTVVNFLNMLVQGFATPTSPPYFT